MTQPNTCPNCNGRLLSGAETCLHCGTRVAAAAPQGGSTSSATTIVLVLAALGLGAIVFFTVGMSKTVDAVKEPLTFDSSNAHTKSCVQETADDQIAEMQDKGWEEVDAKAGMRCFED